MSKYIDKDRVLEYIIFGVVGKDITCGELTRAIESLPTIDIVRCKDCRAKQVENSDEGTSYFWCDYWQRSIDDTDYCSKWKRKEE